MPGLTSDPGGEGAAGDVLVVVADQDVVVAGQRGQVGDRACAVFVVHTADLCLGGALDGQVQTTYTHMLIFQMYPSISDVLYMRVAVFGHLDMKEDGSGSIVMGTMWS